MYRDGGWQGLTSHFRWVLRPWHLGPVAGGALVTLVGWRSIFLVNLPVCVLTVFLLRRYVTESPLNPERRPDVPGLLLGVASLAGLTAGFITAGQLGWFSPVPGALLAAGAAAACLFVRAERRRRSPMLPLALFRSRNLSGATGVGVIFNLVLYGSLLCLSLFLQQSRHEPVLATGLLLVPMSLVVGAGSLASGGLTARLGSRPPMLAGLTLASPGSRWPRRARRCWPRRAPARRWPSSSAARSCSAWSRWPCRP